MACFCACLGGGGGLPIQSPAKSTVVCPVCLRICGVTAHNWSLKSVMLLYKKAAKLQAAFYFNALWLFTRHRHVCHKNGIPHHMQDQKGLVR